MTQSAILVQRFLEDEGASVSFAQKLAQALKEVLGCEKENGIVVYLNGDLGAGKSFLSRALIQSYDSQLKVKSPTYTLVESYEVDLGLWPAQVHHFDLYRLCDPEELEFLAIRDLFQGRYIALVEWPEKGQPIFPAADIVIDLQHQEVGRNLILRAYTDIGQEIVEYLE